MKFYQVNLKNDVWERQLSTGVTNHVTKPSDGPTFLKQKGSKAGWWFLKAWFVHVCSILFLVDTLKFVNNTVQTQVVWTFFRHFVGNLFFFKDKLHLDLVGFRCYLGEVWTMC